MALVTGGTSGQGLLATYEYALQGKERVVAVAKSAHLSPGEQEGHLLDLIQDIASHYVIRADIGDAGAWSDALAFANNIGAHDDYNPSASMREAEAQLREMDSLDVITVLISSLRSMLAEGTPIDNPKLNRVLTFRNNMSRGLAESMQKANSQPLDVETHERLLFFQDNLQELSEVLSEFRKRGLVQDRTGADSGPLGGLFPAEAAAARRHAEALRAAERGPEPPAGPSGQKVEQGGDALLLEMMEQELTRQRIKGMAAQKGVTACGNLDSLGVTSDVIPGSKGPTVDRSKATEPVPGARADRSERAEPVLGTATDGSKRAEPAPGAEGSLEQPAARAPAPPDSQRHCERCGQECAASSSQCAKCQRGAEHNALGDAIRRAQEEAESKRRKEAERKTRLAEEARKQREEAERKAREAEQGKAEEEAVQRARVANERRAAEAEQKAKGEADLKSLEDYVCPKGHVLESFPAQAGFPCDVCERETRQGDLIWGCRNKDKRGCRTCDYDICEKCRAGRQRGELRAKGKKV